MYFELYIYIYIYNSKRSKRIDKLVTIVCEYSLVQSASFKDTFVCPFWHLFCPKTVFSIYLSNLGFRHVETGIGTLLGNDAE